jgi:hypothetical protein
MNYPSFTTLIKALTSWQAVIDILLIAAGLFLLYRTLLRLGTWRIVAGIIITMLIFLSANGRKKEQRVQCYHYTNLPGKHL